MPPAAVSERLAASLLAHGVTGQRWVGCLPELLSSLETDWGITCGAALEGGNAAYVAEASTNAGRPVVLKVALPAGVEGFAPFDQELAALQIAGGDPYVELISHDLERRCLLLERLGRPLAALGWSTTQQLTTVAQTLMRGWRPLACERLPDGGAKAGWLAGFVVRSWQELGQPCTEAAVERAVTYATDRAAHFDPSRAVLVHGDAHGGNLLEAPRSLGDHFSFRLVDPEGLVSEPAHDLGVALRAWNDELLAGDTGKLAVEQHQLVAHLTGVNAHAIWQWSFVERVSSGLFLLSLGHEREARDYLDVADRLAEVLAAW